MNNSSSDPLLLLAAMQRAAFRKYQLIPISIITAVGFVANAMVIFCFLKKSFHKKTGSDPFILSLAVSDFGVICYYVPIHMVEFTVGLNVSHWTCKYIIPVRETFIIMSIVAIAELGMVRFFCFFSSRVLSKRVTCLIIGSTWLFAYLAISLPISFVIKRTRAMTCDHFWENEESQKTHIGLVNLIQFIPLLVTTFCYGSIIQKVRSLKREHSDRISSELTQSNFLMILLIITAWLSLAPFLLYSLLSQLEVQMNILLVWSTVAVLLISGSAINPVLILLMHKDYRNEIWRILHKSELTISLVTTPTAVDLQETEV